MINTYFFGCNLSLSDHIGLLYKFYLKRTATEAGNELNVGYSAARSNYAWFRECIHKYMQDDFHPNFKFDAQHATEWDEASLSKTETPHWQL